MRADTLTCQPERLLLAVALLLRSLRSLRPKQDSFADWSRSMINRLQLPLTALLLMASSRATSTQQSVEWKDRSPHKVTLVSVEDSVQLEVLDWRGSGRSQDGMTLPASPLD